MIKGKQILAFIPLGKRDFLCIVAIDKCDGRVKVTRYHQGVLDRCYWHNVYQTSEGRSYFYFDGSRYYLRGDLVYLNSSKGVV